MPKVFQLRHSAHPLSNKHRPAWRLCFFLLCHRSLLSVLSMGTVSVWGVGATSSTWSGWCRNWRAQAVCMSAKVRSWSTSRLSRILWYALRQCCVGKLGDGCLDRRLHAGRGLVDRWCAECRSWKTLGVEVFQSHVRDAWGEKCAAVMFSRAALSIQVLGAGSVVPESRMKTRGLWGELCARVFGPRATEQWACARRESLESVVPESMN
jgi:hypothetical protein